jgi:2-phosphosulfolactate phosphatase
MTRIDVAVLPAEALAIGGDCFIVVDVLRATTTIATLFGRGLRTLLVMDDLEAARTRGRTEQRLLFGELQGLRPDGFDYGNSPADAAVAPVAGQDAVLFTTNGTRALCRLAGEGVVFAGAIANCDAIAAATTPFQRIVIACAGQAAGTRFGQDDFFAAGVIASRIRRLAPDSELGDAARLAIELTASMVRLTSGLRDSEHGRITAGIGFERDIAFALQPDTSGAAPRVVGYGQGWALLEAD